MLNFRSLAAFGQPAAAYPSFVLLFGLQLTKVEHPCPKLWVRHVDDTYCVIEQQYAEEFHQHLNSISPSITFTLEGEKNQSLVFLDVKVTRNKDNTISQPSAKNPLTLTDISNLTCTIPNTTNLL